MTDWRAFIDNGGILPDGLDMEQAVRELGEMVRSPDPVVRDELGYVAVVRLLPQLDKSLKRKLGATMTERFEDSEIQARTFAPLILNALVSDGEFDEKWLAAFEAWYPNEQDLRGHDQDRGWLHAVAHGADLLGTFGRHPQVDPERMLTLAARRLLAKTEYVLRDQEDDRLACALALTLTREELTETTSAAWLAPIATDFENGDSGPVPPHATNTMRTLRMLYLLVDRGVRPGWSKGETEQVRHREVVKQRLAEVLALVAPFAG